MESFFIYRMPDSKIFSGGRGKVVAGLSSGFVIAPFEWDEEKIFTIKEQQKFELSDLSGIAVHKDSTYELFPLPLISTSKEEHIRNVGRFISQLNTNEKAVCARILCVAGDLDLTKSLISLADAFPHAFIYCFSSPMTGTWLGATPEKLLNVSGDEISTMALAGTRLAGTQEDWDKKNINEQRIVADFIRQTFLDHHLPIPDHTPTFTKNAGAIEHLCTEFSLPLPPEFGPNECKALLRDLSPTPALCGYPREKALTLIKESESFSRGYYGGFIGPANLTEMNLSLFVILRSVRLAQGKSYMFVGGGISADSDPSTEWMETENKANSILSKIVFAK